MEFKFIGTGEEETPSGLGFEPKVMKPGDIVDFKSPEGIEFARRSPKLVLLDGDRKAYTRGELELMNMRELRKIGNPLGAKDTKKSELIDEIIERQGVI